MKSCRRRDQRSRYGLILLLLTAMVSLCDSFGLASQAKQTRSVNLATSALPDISEVLNGESCVDAETAELLDGTPLLSADGEDAVASFAPPLTYEKYLRMQVSLFHCWTMIQHSKLHFLTACSFSYFSEQARPRFGAIFGRVGVEALLSHSRQENQRSLS
jgi:hypothetical protein